MGRNILSRTLRARATQLDLAVEVGRVLCPTRGTVDVELCFTCSAYRGFQAGRSERLFCAPASASLGALVSIPFGFVPR